MEDANYHQDHGMNNDANEDNYKIDEEDSDDEDAELDFNMDVFQRLKLNDPSVTHLRILLNCDDDDGDGRYQCYFNSIDWTCCISDNTQLKSLRIHYISNHQHYKETGHNDYTLGEEGNYSPPRQQLQDFFSCIYQNRSINTLVFDSIRIVDEFGGDLIEGLCGHSSLVRLEIGYGKLGSVGCSALAKVLKHPKSKLKSLRLPHCELNDEEISIVYGALLGNSTIRTLYLGNRDISSIGRRALLPVLQHPNCKLVELDLHETGINDEMANLLGTALRGSSLKNLNLSSNKSISSAGWHMLCNYLTQSSIVRLGLGSNKIDDSGLAVLAGINTLCCIDLHRNLAVTPTGWHSFFNILQTNGTQLKELEISTNRICAVGIQALGSLLNNMSSLKILYMYNMLNGSASASDFFSISKRVTPQCWVSFFNSLQDSNLNIAKLDFGSSNIDDRGLQLLIPLVSRISSLKFLGLSKSRFTSAGLQALIGFLQRPNFTLEELFLHGNYLNNDLVVVFASALEHNKTLKVFSVNDPRDPSFFGDGDDEDVDEEQYDDEGFFNITERGWAAVSTLLCNKTSIMGTFNSNHTLHDVCYDQETGSYRSGLPDDLKSYLVLNENQDKTEVARQKILQTHFSTEDDTTTNIQEFLDMELEMMPTVIEWIGRLTPIDWKGESVSGLSLLYNIMQKLPDLFDSNAIKKPSMGKRKREVFANGLVR